MDFFDSLMSNVDFSDNNFALKLLPTGMPIFIESSIPLDFITISSALYLFPFCPISIRTILSQKSGSTFGGIGQ
jgi:hypothetical protein